MVRWMFGREFSLTELIALCLKTVGLTIGGGAVVVLLATLVNP